MTAIRSLQSIPLPHLLLMFMLGALAGLIYMSLSPIWWLMSLGMAIIIAVFISNRTGIGIILLALFILQWLFGVFRAIPKEITWLPDVIIMILTAKFFYLQADRHRLITSPIDKVIAAILLLGLLSAIYNNVSPITVLFGYRKFFKYTLLFYILRHIESDDKFYRFFFYIIFILLLAQIPVTIAQAIVYGTIGKDVADNVSGTLGWKATGAMALLMNFAISMMIGFYTQTHRLRFVAVALLFTVPIILGSGQYGLIMLPLTAITCWLLGHEINLKNLVKVPLLVSVIIMLVIPAINYHDYRYHGNLLKFLSSPSEIYSLNIQTRKEGTFGRFQVIDVAHRVLSENPAQLLIGFGPGNASESYFHDYSGKLEKEFRGMKIWGIQYTAIILEYGFLGLLLFLWLFFKLWRLNRHLYHRTSDPFWKSITVGYNGMILAYLLGCLYNPAWYYDILAFCFWLTTAGLATRLAVETKLSEAKVSALGLLQQHHN
ncbi:MAG: hypothetical protein ONB11_02800 [candidate division KSB1 bacterium]|nr:hypothetical protein [candidate division KSB1 bacterium]MDZ7341333.1 hypothetical protein [candidate division KSB1 bacterium]